MKMKKDKQKTEMNSYTVDDDGVMTLRGANGTYFRSAKDFDYGWLYRYPWMTYSQMRRSKQETFIARAGHVWVYFVVSLLPILGIVEALNERTWASLPAVPLSLAFAVWVYRVQRRIEPYVWHGRLMEDN